MRARQHMRAYVMAAVVAGLAAAMPASAQPVIKHVLIIHGGPEAFPGNPVFDDSLRQVLFAHPTIQVAAHSEYLENEEFAAAAYTSLREYLRVKLADRRPDLVIANTAPAVEFVLRYRDELFPNVPVVFIAPVAPPGLAEGTLRGVTGVLRQLSQAETVELALKLHPSTRRVHVVAYAPAVDGFQERVRSALTPISRRVTVTFVNERSLPEMLAVVKALPADSLMFWVRYSPVTRGRVVFPDEFLPEIAAAAPVPIYAALEANLDKGVVGGMMRNNIADTRKLGGMALRILEGVAPESIALEAAAMQPIFDWRALQRWGIAESALPAGSDIRYRVPTVWQLYAPYIVGTLIVVTAQLVLIAGLLRERARVRHANNTIRAREASLRASYERIKHMAGRLINAQEAARAEIARDLHDDVCQKLAHVSLGVNSLRHATGDIQGPSTQEALQELDRDTHTAFDGIRRLSHDLHPATLRLLGLAPALRAHCSEVAKRHGVEVQFSSDDTVGQVPSDVAVCFFRVAQESLRNGIVHGGATHLTVRLGRAGDQLELAVTDNGRGFDVTSMNGTGGLGLVTMEERVNLVGGSAAIVSQVGHGTTVRVVAPAAESVVSGTVQSTG